MIIVALSTENHYLGYTYVCVYSMWGYITAPPPPFVFSGKHPLPTSLRSVCSILHYLFVCITAIIAGRERLRECFLRKTKGGGEAVRSKSDIYSLVLPYFLSKRYQRS